jgi:hypothetical protein
MAAIKAIFIKKWSAESLDPTILPGLIAQSEFAFEGNFRSVCNTQIRENFFFICLMEVCYPATFKILIERMSGKIKPLLIEIVKIPL